VIAKRKSVSLANASRPVIELMEQRQLLSATLSVSNSLAVFNAVENGSASATETVTLTDTGNAALALGSSAFAIADNPSAPTQDAARFTLVNAGSAPATLSPGGSFALQLNYNSIAVTTNSAFLEISSNDPVNPTTEVTLHGIGTKGLGGTNQPSLATLLQAYDIPTYVGEGVDDANAATDSTYPNPPDASSQEVVLQRLEKAGAGPVTINVLASFTASGFAKSYVLGTYTPGEPQTMNELFYDTASENQTTWVQPQGSTSFDPGSNPFGFYFISNVQTAGRVGYSEDALNTWDTTNPRKFRFFPMEQPNGTVVPNTYITTSTEWNAPAGYDFTNIVAIVSNVKAAPSAPTAPVMGVQNLNAVPGSNTMVFNTIKGTNPSVGDQVHNTGTLQVNNTGQSPLIISSYTLSPQWQLVSPPTFPVTVAAGATLALPIKFIATTLPSVPYNETNSNLYATGGGVWDGTLVLNSNDPNNPVSTTQLRGYWQQNSENDNEPGFMTMANLLFGWDTYINSTPVTTLSETNSSTGSPTYYGEEVVSGYWAQADASTPVSVQQIAGYHTEGNTASTYWYPQGASGSKTQLFETASDDGQTLFPYAINTTTPAAATFNTTDTFGFDTDGVFSDDALNPGTPGAGHHFRFYPIRDANGDLVPNTYIMTMDYDLVPENYDFQDNVYIVKNIRPVTVVSGINSPQSTGAPPAPVDLNALSSNGVTTLQWAAPLYSSISGYNVLRASSSAGPFTQLNTGVITTSNYTDTTAPGTGTSYYKVQTVDSVTSQHSLSDQASVVNTGTSTTGDGAPVAATETATTNAGTAVNINVVASATDNTNGSIEASTVTVTRAPVDGTTSVDPTTGIITYTPAAGFTGTDNFYYSIGDNTGATSAPALVSVTVNSQPIGDPVAQNLSYGVTENEPFPFNPSTSATDDASATIIPTSVNITQPPAHGTATVDPATGTVTYTPNASYLGQDTLQYTVSDTLGAVSQPATVGFTVSTLAPVTGPVSVPVSATASSNSGATPVDIDVLSDVSDPDGTVVPSSVTISTDPKNGTATVDTATGQIIYTPAGGFVGSDALQYTVSDSNGLVSSPAIVSIGVGVTINNSTAKSLVFVDASGSKVTVVLAGGGSAMVFFTGSGTAQTLSAAHHTGNVIVSGNPGEISGVSVSGSTIASSLTIARKGLSSTSVGNIAVAGAIGKITASTTSLNGPLNISGGVNSIQFESIRNAAITIGSSGAKPGGVTLVSTTVTDSSLISALPIKTLKAAQWSSTRTAGIIIAPSISSLVITGNFQANITATGASPFSLNSVRIGGQLGGDAWNITGKVNSILLGSVAPGFTGAFSSTLNAFTVKAGGFSGTLSTAVLGTLSVVGNDTGKITAGSIRFARFVGDLNNAEIIVTNGVTPHVNSLGRLTVTGETLSSEITSAGNVGIITTGGISGSSIDAGVASGIFLPDVATHFTAAATLSSFSITGRRNTFVDSNISAQMIGGLNLGTITTANDAMLFGIAGGTIGSLSATLDVGGLLRMNKAVLASSGSLATYLTDHSLSLGDFVIRPAL
jgi:hypothetical protein